MGWFEAVVLGVVVLAAVVVALLAFLVGPRFARYDVLDRAAVERGVTEVVTRDWRRPATAASTSGRASSAPMERSTCRPPCVLTTSPSTPASSACRASSGCRTPLSSSGSRVWALSQARSVQVIEGRE